MPIGGRQGICSHRRTPNLNRPFVAVPEAAGCAEDTRLPRQPSPQRLEQRCAGQQRRAELADRRRRRCGVDRRSHHCRHLDHHRYPADSQRLRHTPPPRPTASLSPPLSTPWSRTSSHRPPTSPGGWATSIPAPHDIIFPRALRVALYRDWSYVLVEAGPEQPLTWRTGHMRRGRGSLPDLFLGVDPAVAALRVAGRKRPDLISLSRRELADAP